MDRFDAIVIGAGVVGLSIARALAISGLSVLIIEREGAIGRGVSARNSEVIHAGLHYAAGSLKERLCIAGRDRLYAYCVERQLPHRRCGKLIVAHDAADIPALEAIAVRAAAAGVDDILILDRAEARSLEPVLDCAMALSSPSSGIIDIQRYMLALLGEAEDHGAMLARGTTVDTISRIDGVWVVRAGGDRASGTMLVNAAGLDAQAVAAMIDGYDRALIPPRFLARGCYFTYSGRLPFSRLIYPIPVSGGLGTHLTLDLAGQGRFGPDIEWIETVDHAVDPGRHEYFTAAARRIWPGIDADRLIPAYAGIRPKLHGPGEPDADFMIQGRAAHGQPGLVNLFGIESPGLTASLAIGDHVAALLGVEVRPESC